MLGRFQMDQCKPLGKNSSWFDFETSDSTKRRREKWIKGSTDAWLDHFCIWPNRRGKTSCLVTILFRHMNALTNKYWFCGKRLLWYLQGSKALKLTYRKEFLWFSRGKWSRLVWWCERQKFNDGLLLQTQRTWRSTQVERQDAGHGCSFIKVTVDQKQNIRSWSQQFK